MHTCLAFKTPFKRLFSSACLLVELNYNVITPSDFLFILRSFILYTFSEEASKMFRNTFFPVLIIIKAFSLSFLWVLANITRLKIVLFFCLASVNKQLEVHGYEPFVRKGINVNPRAQTKTAFLCQSFFLRHFFPSAVHH